MNLAGIISGKAIYEGRFTIAEAHDILDSSGERAA
jgi:phosphoribosylformimino-5-aminoimidazole carboxamide ribonucleotide (ProFAR) isomerase